MADVLRELEAEHRTVEQLFEQIEKTDDASARERLVVELDNALSAHMNLEERVVYPAMVEVGLDDPAAAAHSEHDHARDLLGQIESGLQDDPGIDGVIAAMKAAIEHHVEEEESEAFPRLRERLGDEGMAELSEAAQSFREGGNAVIDLDAASKDELYDAARRQGVEGRSTMTKDELRAALGS